MQIRKIFPLLLIALSVIVNNGCVVKSFHREWDQVYSQYDYKYKQDLREIIKDTTLGEFCVFNENTAPSREAVASRLKQLYLDLHTERIIIYVYPYVFPPLGVGYVSIYPRGLRKVFDTNGVMLTYTIRAVEQVGKPTVKQTGKQALSQIIKITNPVEFDISNENTAPSIEEIVSRLERLCPDLNTAWIHIDINSTLEQIVIYPNSLGCKCYTGRVTFTYISRAIREAYKILGLGIDAPSSDVTRSYRKLMQQCHPDKNLHKDENERRKYNDLSQELNAARELIKARDERINAS